ncbi:hypothetical protein C8R43DRAFT_1132029 [Mycena crocata]|nr:hypothetical protein C8R43DRAFT_1132029 [Mycena crocata]
MFNLRVRKLDLPTALGDSSPGTLLEIGVIGSVLSKAYASDVFTAVVTGKLARLVREKVAGRITADDYDASLFHSRKGRTL